MNALKCTNCGFVGFLEAGYCKCCRRPVTLQNFHTTGPSLADRVATRVAARLVNLLKLSVLLMILGAIIGVAAVVRQAIKKYFDPTPAYIQAMTKSANFKEPITVRVNQQELHDDFEYVRPGYLGKPGFAVPAANVLEALNLITMNQETTSQGSESEKQVYNRDTGQTELIQTFAMKRDELVISLTEKGRQEAVHWRETEELVALTPKGKIQTSSKKATWWRIPIGERLFIRIESVTPFGVDMVDVVFRWRWQPNKIGENFDGGGTAVNSLPQKARDAVSSIGWNSTTEYSSHAQLRKSGDLVEVLHIESPDKQED